MTFITAFKATLRHLLKNKLYLGINILSLAVGLLCCLFAYKYIQFELSYDRFHVNYENIFRVEYESVTNNDNELRFANLHGNALPENINSIPEIDLSTRFAKHAQLNIKVENQQFGESKILAAESSFFKLFTFDFISGKKSDALTNPSSVVLNKSTAIKYFDSTDVLGETVTISFQGKEILLTVNGIVNDVPSNSHFDFDIITSTQIYKDLYGFSIYDVQLGYNYIQLNEASNSSIVEEKLNQITPVSDPESEISYFLQPLADIHLYSSSRGELTSNSDIKYIYFLALVTLLILGVACVNFTTLTTALSIKRLAEIGIRKAFGAVRSNLISGFLVQGILLSTVGLLFAYFFIWGFLPFINSLADVSFSFTDFLKPGFISVMLLVTLFIGCLAALYPALVSTGYKTSSLLLKRTSTSLKGSTFWKGVIVAQFSATLILVAGSYTIHQQLDYIQNKDLGFDKEQIITMPNYFRENSQPFLQELEKHPNIEHSTISSYIPGISSTSGTATVQTQNFPSGITFDWISIDHNYLDTYGIELKEGRSFSNQRSSDSTQAFIINETAANALGWESPIGENITALGKQGNVIGVIKDFNFLSLHNEISPLVMTVNEQLYFSISAKINSTDKLPETVLYIKQTWESMIPGALFSYNFVDEQFDQAYKTEKKAQSLFLTLSLLAIFVAVLGLFSFASFSVSQKQKEIGVRKVLGASIYDVLQLFYRGYLKFLLFASIIAFPIIYFWINNWLQNFSYSIKVGLDIFAVPLLVALFTIFISVSYQTTKAAIANPADTIRSE